MLIPKKSLGQNFLIDKNICNKISKQTPIFNKNIIEIGAGTGLLTDHIIKLKPKKLIIIEKDENLIKKLKQKYIHNNNIKIISIDVLKYDFDKPYMYSIISNLPYNISSKFILKILKENYLVEEILILIQKELAEKMNYHKNIKNNKFNFFISCVATLKIKFKIPNNVFYPKPKIQSTLISLKPVIHSLIDKNKLELFAKKIFSNKRKKISNVINIKVKNEKILKLFNKRAEDLKKEELLYLFNKF